MKYYVISPVSNLDPMKLGDSFFVLAHLWVKYPNYRETILRFKSEFPEKWVTLDCSAAERALVTEDVLIDVCHQLMPNEVIAPDVLFNTTKTVLNATTFRSRMQAEGLLDEIDIFFCPQGSDQQSWLEAYVWGLDQPWIKTIGLSKIAIPRAWLGQTDDDQDIKQARHKCYDYLVANKLLRKPIHCLGMGDPTEFSHYTNPMVRSTDSVFPILAASMKQDFRKDSATRVATPHDFLERYDMSHIDLKLVKSNVAFLQKECRGYHTRALS